MLTKLDDLNLPDHWYLDSTDECYFIGEYTAGKGYFHSATNNLIINLKKGAEKRGLPEWKYKERAIRAAAEMLRESLNPDFMSTATFIPVPPSKVATDPLYDDRMTQVVSLLGERLDMRELVFQLESTQDAHTAASRPGPNDLYENYQIRDSLRQPVPQQIAIVDDVLTTGAHFKAMKSILQETYGAIPILGVFLSRRVPNTE